MKRRSKTITIITLIFLCISAVAFAACGGTKRIKLPAPVNLQIEGTILTWDKVEHASGYMLNIDGGEKVVTTNSYDLSADDEFESHSIQVKSLGDGKKYSSSAWSHVKEYAKEAEQRLEMVYDKSAYGYRVAGIGTVTSSEIVIPEFYEGLPVVYISSEAFKDNTKITKVTLSDMTEMIGESAFQGCTSLESVIFPEYGKLEVIQRNAFSGCSSLKAIDIPDTVTCISSGVFAKCINLESAKLPKKLEFIEKGTFSGTSKLKSITLPDSLLAINMRAFYHSGIEHIKIPKSVLGIYGFAFEGSDIASVEFEEGSALETIWVSAFSECINLKSINIPESVTRIGGDAFNGCSNLELSSLPANLTTIGDKAFYGCDNLKLTGIVGANLTSIGESAFKGLGCLESVIIPAGVTEIGDEAFADCVNLKEVIIDKNSQMTTLGSVFHNTAITEITIPKSVRYISGFDNLSSLKTVRFEDDSALTYLTGFRGCCNLTTVDLGKNSKVTNISINGFENCTKLSAIEIPNTVKNIEANAFAGCTSIKSIIIPEGVTWIYKNAFAGWTKDQIIYVENLSEAPSGWYNIKNNWSWLDGSEATVVWNYKPE